MTRQLSEADDPTAAIQDLPTSKPRRRNPFVAIDELRVASVLAVIVIVVSVFHPQFLSIGSIANITQQASFFGIMALGMVFLMSMGELDLSVGGNFAFCAMITAMMAAGGVNLWLAALIAILVGAILGAINALLSNALGVPMIVITLGTLASYRGMALIVNGAQSATGGDRNDPFFTVLGGSLFGIPALSVALVVLTIVLTILYRLSSFGFAVRAIGSNLHAARLSGYRVSLIKVQTSSLLGALCGISGVLSFAFFGASDPAVGTGYELLVIAAAVIGGTALTGGRGTVPGAMLGAIVVSVISGALTAFGVSVNYAAFVTGIVIIGAVALDSALRRRPRS
ncbi:ABC transporter permease [Microbacterium sp. ARD31]|uniref:ABC transporter permease n=1 Tax=Microbacterium sp. ARD31 TaxID=2962576 RepID=UPI0028813376|nr:ABC transporter permease [Microbacterium sp. ARD31]MDT0183995.1 ABC transporter permease [Microbacterium sp. ARD31]